MLRGSVRAQQHSTTTLDRPDPMALSHRERKMRWARSGNMCAFPKCTQLLVEMVVSGGSSGVVVGEEAHIVARERNGPRGSDVDDTVIDSYSNHILLCPTHHRIVDEQPDAYPAVALRAMKRQHEDRVRFRLHPGSTGVEIPVEPFRGVFGQFEPIIAWRLRSTTIVVYSFGSPPVRRQNGHLVGSGLQLVEAGSSGTLRSLLMSSEGDPDIEFWVEDDSVHVIQQTYDPDSGGFVPLTEHVFDGSRSPVRRSMSLLLGAP